MEQYSAYLGDMDDSLALIQALFEHNRAEALKVTEFALIKPELDHYKTGVCYKWLSEHLSPDNPAEQRLLFEATDLAMQVSPELSLFKRREKYTSPDKWPDIRSYYLGNCQSGYDCENIMIYAGEYDMACDSLERRGFWFSSYDQSSVSMLETLKQKRPEWVKSFARKMAEEAIATTKVNAYPGAVDILWHVKELCLSGSQNDEWQTYLQHLMTVHKRKRKLIPLLEQLG